MQASLRRFVVLAAIVPATSLLAVACADKVVYEDNRIPTPPVAAAGFLGFEDAAKNVTVCGNCHVGHQSDWRRTAHADAFATLTASPSKQASCEGCHTTNHRGSAVVDTTGGWTSVKDPRYHDVQCESCHGPGLTHAENPEASQPVASIAVSATAGCGECHNGTHHPFMAEWSKSGHAQVIASPASRAECQACHTAKGALDAWGVTAIYKEKAGTTGHTLGVVCAVCHDPHSNEASRRSESGTGATNALTMPASGGQLRYSVDVPSEEQNLCMKCHHKRAQPELDATQFSRGPHSPEGPLLLGENVGFWFGDIPVDARIVGTHGTAANPRLCATCHMVQYEVNDKMTGSFKLRVVGHSFEAIPCVGADGIPTGSTTCTVNERSFRGCLGSGCHGTETSARAAYTVVNLRVASLTTELKRLIDLVRATEIKSNDGKWTSAEGADFNYQLALKQGSSIHNPFMIEALLTASINEMHRKYNIRITPNLDLRNTIGAHLTTAGKTE